MENGNSIEFHHEDQFISRFRLSKDKVVKLERILQGVLSRANISHPIPVSLHMYTLRFMPTSHFLRSDDDWTGLSQRAVSVIVQSVVPIDYSAVA